MTELVNPKSLLDYHLSHGWSAISRPLGEAFAIDRREEYALSALKGGDVSMGDTPSAVKSHFKVQRRDAENLCLGGARVLRDKFSKICNDVLRIDPAEVAAIAPTLKLGLTDGELARLASDNRNSLGALRAIASLDSAYSRALKRALDGFAEAVEAVPAKVYGYTERACYGENDVARAKDPDLLKSLIDHRIADVDAAWACLGDAIEGTSTQDPLQAALDNWAANR